ncbi:hypothetical protein [Streptomyces olivochromogenes]|uniref:hypothetical protein n=1 Tax=Streptomyces olivochromogenes TaxID=1963 RepID=UPI001F19E89D|nr:hypothetical protein [Streptomyces olivochromogenes]MCF3135044.1 hypothetical protein [Streptomyces olivochromogenes]
MLIPLASRCPIGAADEAARRTLDLPTDPDARWNVAVVLVRSLPARGAGTEDEQLIADHGLDGEDLEEWDSWDDDRSLS